VVSITELPDLPVLPRGLAKFQELLLKQGLGTDVCASKISVLGVASDTTLMRDYPQQLAYICTKQDGTFCY